MARLKRRAMMSNRGLPRRMAFCSVTDLLSAAQTSSASHGGWVAPTSITLSTYSHAFARRDTAPLGEALAAFMRKESAGLDLGSGGENRERHSA